MHEQVHIYIHVYNMYVHTYFSILRHDIAADTISLPEWSAGPYKIPLNNFPRTVKACSVLGAAVPLACDLHFAGDSRRGISYAEPSEGMSFFSLPLSPSPGQGRSSCVPRAGRGQQDATRCRIPLGRRCPPHPLSLLSSHARCCNGGGGGLAALPVAPRVGTRARHVRDRIAATSGAADATRNSGVQGHPYGGRSEAPPGSREKLRSYNPDMRSEAPATSLIVLLPETASCRMCNLEKS